MLSRRVYASQGKSRGAPPHRANGTTSQFSSSASAFRRGKLSVKLVECHLTLVLSVVGVVRGRLVDIFDDSQSFPHGKF